MAGFYCTSKYHYGDRWVGDPLYQRDIWSTSLRGTCFDCVCCEYRMAMRKIPTARQLHDTKGVTVRTGRRWRREAKKLGIL